MGTVADERVHRVCMEYGVCRQRCGRRANEAGVRGCVSDAALRLFLAPSPLLRLGAKTSVHYLYFEKIMIYIWRSVQLWMLARAARACPQATACAAVGRLHMGWLKC